MPKLKPLFLGLMLLLTSCSDASTDQTDVSASSPSHAPSREWNVEDWTPKAPITPIEMTDEQKEAWRKGRIENDIPADADRSLYKDPGLVKYYDSYQEAGDAIVQCLKQKGFDARSDATGGIIPESVTSSQNLALDVALFECFAMHMPAPEIYQDWTEEQLGMAYDYWDEYFIPCIIDHGYGVDRSNQPTRESFVSTFFEPGKRSDWYPPELLSLTIYEGKDTDVIEDCPTMPPNKYFYGR